MARPNQAKHKFKISNANYMKEKEIQQNQRIMELLEEIITLEVEKMRNLTTEGEIKEQVTKITTDIRSLSSVHTRLMLAGVSRNKALTVKA